MSEPTTEAQKAQVALVSAIWHCIVDASSMNVVMSGGEVNAAIRGFRSAVEAEAVADFLSSPKFEGRLADAIFLAHVDVMRTDTRDWLDSDQAAAAIAATIVNPEAKT